MAQVSRREELCNQIHMELGDMIVEKRGMISEVEVPMITESRGDAVAVSNYLRGVGYNVRLEEDMHDFLYTLIVSWR